MDFKLEPLSYQEEARDAVKAVFKGQLPTHLQATTFLSGVTPNILSLTKNDLYHNIKAIREKNGLSAIPHDFYDFTAGNTDSTSADTLATASFEPKMPSLKANGHQSSAIDISVEMETGTGKTLVYIQTIFELVQSYGFSKFIILVPSIAIREGVLQTWTLFKAPLEHRYNLSPNVFAYERKKLSLIRNFALQNHPQVMIVTLQSFNSDKNILNQSRREDLPENISYMKAIARTRPIVIMDEPQESMDTDNARMRIEAMNPLCKIRYSATHKYPINLVYRLTPYQSYEQRLVKKIEILTVAEKNDEASMKLELVAVDVRESSSPQAIIKAWHNTPQGFVFKKTRKLSPNAHLEHLTQSQSYKGYVIERIHKPIRDRAYVQFSNGIKIYEGDQAKDYTSIFSTQLYWLIDTHFRKRKRLKKRGIKCLSLIFIDRVNNYIGDHSIIKKSFITQYKKVFKKHYNRIPTAKEIDEIQGYYFAKAKTGDFTDNERSMQKDKALYNLIFKDKEKLLSFESPVEFIFSHSALGVGWDNPNIFNIATLNQRHSEIKKRQELGRGLRICVDQTGNRIHDDKNVPEGEECNILTVIPNESYETFLSQYQSELAEIYGTTPRRPQLRHSHLGENRSGKRISRRNKHFTSQAFRHFWQRLAQKTSYLVTFDEKKVVAEAIDSINEIVIPKVVVEVQLAKIESLSEKNIDDTITGRDQVSLQTTAEPFPLTDIISEISHETNLVKKSVIEIFKKLTPATKKSLINNPGTFMHEACRRIKTVMLDNMIRTLKYRRTGQTFDLTAFAEQLIKHTEKIEPTPKKGLYDHIVWDSELEKQFAKAAENDPQVVCFLKLPPFYVINTPVGDYNPDFGLILKHKKIRARRDDEYYFVIEIKGTHRLDDRKILSRDEIYKIKCAIKHFQALGIEANIENPIEYRAPIKDYASFKKDIENAS
ncbi:hypothetical protein COTS27_00966 [Spirochaetota bacterium]|nr:hypothetical protein COTS27_00966 [Spirochaetota bacterium]